MVFYNTQTDVPFMANWTNLTFSQDIDAVVTAARAVAVNQNVFLGGHSAGTGFTARYAATDFNLTGVGPADPGYAKLRGLVLLEGGGGSTAGAPPPSDRLTMEVARRRPVRRRPHTRLAASTAPPPCTVATEAATASARPGEARCRAPMVVADSEPRILGAGELTAIQAILDPDGTENLVRVDQGSAGNNAVAKVPDLSTLSLLPHSTAQGGLGSFVDDDGAVASLASFVATSVGAPGATVGGLLQWQDVTEGPFAPAVLPNNGPPPASLPGVTWGQEKEVTRNDKLG
jgi:hypothetical protein